MKRTLITLALTACLGTLASAKQLYNITLSNSEQYTECALTIQSDTDTTFRGKDAAGKLVTKAVSNSEILQLDPIPAKPKAEKAKKAEAPKEEPKAEEKPAETPSAAEEDGDGEEPAAEPEKKTAGDKGYEEIKADLDKMLAEADQRVAAITKPKFSLERRLKRLHELVEKRLPDIEKECQELAEIRKDLAEVVGEPFQFTKVTPDQRDLFVKEGKALYDAMVAEMKNKKGRKVGGLDKFEELREGYQGLAEYKDAYRLYLETLKDLQKKWTKLRDAEDRKRAKLAGQRREAMDKEDDKEIAKVTKMLKDQNLDYDTTWVNPSPHNAKMLENCVNRVTDVLRRSDNDKKDENTGKVSDMLGKAWDDMDKAKAALDKGDAKKASDILKKSDALKSITRLNRNVFADKYRKPLLEQRQDLETAIRDCERSLQSETRRLTGATTKLERTVENLERQIESMLRDLDRETEAAARQQQEEEEEAAKAKDEEESADDDSADSGDEEEANAKAEEKKPAAPAKEAKPAAAPAKQANPAKK